MKLRLLFIISMAAVQVTQLSAQISENIRFGFKLSPHISWLNTDTKRISSGSSMSGISVGTIGEWYLNENYILTAGIGITFAQGGTLNYSEGGRLLPEADLSSPVYDSLPDLTTIRYNVQYFEVPFGFRMRTREFGRWRLTFEAPIISLGIKMRARGTINAPGLEETTNENINPEVNFLNMSYGVAAGGEYSLSENVSVLVMLEYRQGFLDVTKDHGVLRSGAFEDSKATTGFVALKAGILF